MPSANMKSSEFEQPTIAPEPNNQISVRRMWNYLTIFSIISFFFGGLFGALIGVHVAQQALSKRIPVASPAPVASLEYSGLDAQYGNIAGSRHARMHRRSAVCDPTTTITSTETETSTATSTATLTVTGDVKAIASGGLTATMSSDELTTTITQVSTVAQVATITSTTAVVDGTTSTIYSTIYLTRTSTLFSTSTMASNWSGITNSWSSGSSWKVPTSTSSTYSTPVSSVDAVADSSAPTTTSVTSTADPASSDQAYATGGSNSSLSANSSIASTSSPVYYLPTTSLPDTTPSLSSSSVSYMTVSRTTTSISPSASAPNDDTALVVSSVSPSSTVSSETVSSASAIVAAVASSTTSSTPTSSLAGTSSTSSTASSASASSSTGLTADEQSALDAQNAAREEAGVPDFTWSDDLAAEAKSYAEYLSANDLFVHSGVAGEGENLYWSSSTASGQLTDAVDSFLSEKSSYDAAGDPVIGDGYTAYGHYTQIIWKTTTEVGCAESEGYVVCRYYPQGNYLGESPFDPAN
ncbi:uncharacterized protein V2V93DRAFT_376435 [Kockiozyma suomiensis]|uniref:uncharacterized protein n=1 Tax=Kockiozyma suomiensis TaxID=1337062 RepID=UPI0033442EDD